jgi:adenylosuccinate synthase
LQGELAAGRRLLFESANGALLDVDHGTYPYVTSSGTTASGVAPGAGVPARTVDRVVGVTKAYATRVGKGPFVTELTGSIGDRIRDKGKEFGTTTGRPRRCGWFDAVATAYSVRFCGVDEIALMHLDTLSGFREVGICTSYVCDGQPMTSLPALTSKLDRAAPIVEMLPGWVEDVSGFERRDDLPDNARRYLDRVESLVGRPITIVSVGPERSQTLVSDVRGSVASSVDGGAPS